MKAFYDHRPSAIEAVGKGSYIYRCNIEEVVPEVSEDNISGAEISQWKCDEVVVWHPLTSDKVIEAVIRTQYSADQELALVNKFNAYQQGMDVSANIVGEYTDYLSFVAEVKRTVRKDFEEDTQIITEAATSPRMCDLVSVISMTINTFQIPDKDALRIKSVYPKWDSLIGKEVQKDEKMLYDDRLWKVLQQHTVQDQYKPGVGTESLYAEIVESAAGTLEDPIPYNGNMELEQGKYYSQSGKVYKCIRDTEIPVYNPLKDLDGIYVEAVI